MPSSKLRIAWGEEDEVGPRAVVLELGDGTTVDLTAITKVVKIKAPMLERPEVTLGIVIDSVVMEPAEAVHPLKFPPAPRT